MNTNLSFKVKVENEKDSIKMLNHLFEKGYKWPDGTTVIANESSYAFVVKDSFIYTIEKEEDCKNMWNSIEYDELEIDQVLEIDTDFINLTNQLNVFYLEDGILLGTEKIAYHKINKILTSAKEKGYIF